MNIKYIVTDEDFAEMVKQSKSFSQVAKAMGAPISGGMVETVRNRIERLGLDCSHFTGKLWNKGAVLGPKRPISDYFDNKCKIASHRLKGLIISSGLKPHQCEECQLTHWLGKLIPLELHHIDGNSDNNTFSNLRLLCPNCHAFTENYRGKSKGSKSKRIP